MSYVFRWLPGRSNAIPDEAWAEVVEYLRRMREEDGQDGDNSSERKSNSQAVEHVYG